MSPLKKGLYVVYLVLVLILVLLLDFVLVLVFVVVVVLQHVAKALSAYEPCKSSQAAYNGLRYL